MHFLTHFSRSQFQFIFNICLHTNNLLQLKCYCCWCGKALIRSSFLYFKPANLGSNLEAYKNVKTNFPHFLNHLIKIYINYKYLQY